MSIESPRAAATTTSTRHPSDRCLFCDSPITSAAAAIYPPSCHSFRRHISVPGDSFVLVAPNVVHPENDDLEDWFAQFARLKIKCTSKSFVESIPSIMITDDDLKESNSCSICMEDFGLGTLADKLPCKHLFHKSCIGEWLKRSNTCPLCRFKLPVEPKTRTTTPVAPLPRVYSASELFAPRPISIGGGVRRGTGALGNALFSTAVSRSNTTGRGVGGYFTTRRGVGGDLNSGWNTSLDVMVDDDGDTLMIEDVVVDADGDIVMADA